MSITIVRRRVAGLKRDAGQRDGLLHDAGHVDADLVDRQVDVALFEPAGRIERQIAAAAQMAARLVAGERAVVDQEVPGASVVTAHQAQRLDVDRMAEAVDRARRAQPEISIADARAVMIEREGAGDVGLERIGFQKGQRLGVFAQAR